MDDDLEAAWRHEQEVAEAREAREKALADCDEMLAMRRPERAERAKQWQPPPEEPPPVRRAVEPRQRPAAQQQSRKEWSDGWNSWAIEVVDGRVGKATREWVGKQLVTVAEAMGGAAGEFDMEVRDLLRGEIKAAIAELRAEIRAEIGAERAAKAAEVRYAVLEARLAEAEQRAAATGPRLVGGADAA